MIEAKEAVRIAKEAGAAMLDRSDLQLEEIERDTYKDREIWMITLSHRRESARTSAISMIAYHDPLAYKRLLIDADTGELLAIKLRETATQ